MKKEHKFNFGTLKLFNAHAIIECNDGVNIDSNEIQEIKKVLLHFFDGVCFGLIKHRTNHYSVNPIALNELFSHEQLVAGAVVNVIHSPNVIDAIEQRIVKSSPLRFFTEMDSAINWINDHLSNHNKTDNA